MSEIMYGVLNMPPELWSDDEVAVAQRHSVYVEASKQLRAQELELNRLKAIIEQAKIPDYWMEFVDKNRIKVEAAFSTATQTAKNYRFFNVQDEDGEAYPFIEALRVEGQPMASTLEELDYLIDAVVSDALKAYFDIGNKASNSD